MRRIKGKKVWCVMRFLVKFWSCDVVIVMLLLVWRSASLRRLDSLVFYCSAVCPSFNYKNWSIRLKGFLPTWRHENGMGLTGFIIFRSSGMTRVKEFLSDEKTKDDKREDTVRPTTAHLWENTLFIGLSSRLFLQLLCASKFVPLLFC